LQVRTEEEIEREERERQARLQRQMQALHAPPPSITGEAQQGPGESVPGQGPAPQRAGPAAEPFVREERKVGRNEPCPCGSGKKYKHCHGALQQSGG